MVIRSTPALSLSGNVYTASILSGFGLWYCCITVTRVNRPLISAFTSVCLSAHGPSACPSLSNASSRPPSGAITTLDTCAFVSFTNPDFPVSMNGTSTASTIAAAASGKYLFTVILLITANGRCCSRVSGFGSIRASASRSAAPSSRVSNVISRSRPAAAFAAFVACHSRSKPSSSSRGGGGGGANSSFWLCGVSFMGQRIRVLKQGVFWRGRAACRSRCVICPAPIRPRSRGPVPGSTSESPVVPHPAAHPAR